MPRRRDTDVTAREGDAADDTVEERPRLAPGTPMMGCYVVKELIGRGGSAEVYRAWHEHCGRMHALKVLRQAHAEDERLRRALLFEGGLLHSLTPKHPALLEVHGVTVDPLTKIEVLALELLDGVDLREHLRCRRRGFGVIEATSLGVHVAATLGYLHKRGIVHGDLKPENVFVQHASVDKQTRLRVIDFMSAITPKDGAPRRRLGTLLYASPETLLENELGPESDVRALGLILYEILARYHPMLGTTPEDTRRLHCESTPAPLRAVAPLVPYELSEIIGRMIARNPKDRPADGTKAAAILADFLLRVRKGPPSDPFEDDGETLSVAAPSVDLSVLSRVEPAREYGPPVQGETVELPFLKARVADVERGPEDALPVDKDGVYPALLTQMLLTQMRRDVGPATWAAMLVIVEGPGRLLGLRYPLAVGAHRLGRARAWSVLVPHSTIALDHCDLIVLAGAVYVTALQKSMGMKVDDRACERAQLRDGARLAVGDVVLEHVAPGRPIPALEPSYVELPPQVSQRGPASLDKHGERGRTETVFATRSPAPSPIMRQIDERRLERALVGLVEAEVLEQAALVVGSPEVLALELGRAFELETQRRLLTGEPRETVLAERLLPFIDWLEVARRKLARHRGGNNTN